MRKRYLGLALLLVAGLLIRLWAMRYPPLPYDMPFWIAWGERMVEGGPRQFYSGGIFIDYAPGYLYVLWLIATVKQALLPNAGVVAYHVLHRLPAVLCDLGTTALIFVILNRTRATLAELSHIQDEWLPLIAAAVYAFNPAVIFNSAAWGQIDGVFTLGLVLALALLFWRHAEAGVAAYVLAFLVKPQAVSLAPLIGLVLLLRYPPRRWLQAGAVGLVLAFAIVFPFFGWGSFLGLVRVLQGSVETYPYTSLFSYNLWGLYGFWEDDTVQVGPGLSLRLIGTLLYLGGLGYGVWLAVRYLRRPVHRAYPLFVLATYFAFLPVMVLTRMHERYLFPVLPLLLLFAGLYYLERESRSWLVYIPAVLYLAVTILHTINLYQVYVYYLNYESGGVDPSNSLFYFVEDNAKVWSILTLLIFVMVLLYLPRWTGPGSRRAQSDRRLLDGVSG